MSDLEPDGSALALDAEALGARLSIRAQPSAPLQFIERIDAVAHWLRQARLACVDPPPAASKAAEWLLDNDYFVDRALKQISKDIGDGDGAHAVFSMINPLLKSDSADKAAVYRIEPYAVAGDIASASPHCGRGGWSWYTGAAAWSWRLAVEGIIGLRQEGGIWHVTPALPRDWPGCEITLRRDGHTIALQIDRNESTQSAASATSGHNCLRAGLAAIREPHRGAR